MYIKNNPFNELIPKYKGRNEQDFPERLPLNDYFSKDFLLKQIF